MVYDPTGDNIALTQDYLNTSGNTAVFWSGNIPAASECFVTYGTSVAFFIASCAAWNVGNLTSEFLAGSTGSSSTGMTVGSGDFLLR
jgi:hypothetical protein